MALNERSRLGGRRTAFRAAFAEQARRLAPLGANDAQLAEFFGVDESTIARWIPAPTLAQVRGHRARGRQATEAAGSERGSDRGRRT